jgi:hypothetical protein
LSLSEATDDESADLWLPDTPENSITATAPALWRTKPVTAWKAWNRLGQQWSKHAPMLAAVFAPLSVVGGVVAVVQGRMLTDQGWTVPLGDAAECGHLIWPHFGRCSSRILAPGW